MSELEDRLSGILNSPEELEKLTRMARSLMGGPGEETEAPPPPEGLMQKLSGLFGGKSAPAQEGGDKLALIAAMGPFLGEKRRKKMSRALQIARAAKLAGVLFAEEGQDGDL